MDWESSVVRFDLGPFLQGETRITELKSAYNILVLEDCNVKPTYRESCGKF